MFDPATFLGAFLVAVLGAAVFRSLQLSARRLAGLDMKSPVNVILCVVVGVLVAAFIITITLWLCLHINHVQLLID